MAQPNALPGLEFRKRHLYRCRLPVFGPVSIEAGHDVVCGGRRVSQPSSLQLLKAEAHRHFGSGDYRLAIATDTRLIAEAQASPDISIELEARSQMVAAMLNLGEFESAIDAATRLLARARQAENEKFRIFAAFWLGLALAKFDLRGRWQEVQALLLEGLEMARAMRDPFLVTYHLARLGGFAVLEGEFDKGLSWLQEALDTTDQVSGEEMHWFRGDIYGNLAELMIRRREFLEARRYAEISLAEFESYGRQANVGYPRAILAEIHYECGEWIEARHLLGLILESARSTGSAPEEQGAEYLRSKVERQLGDLETSLGAGNRSLELARQLHRKEAEVEVLMSVGQTLRMLGSDDDAAEALDRARQISEERGYDDHLQEVKLLLGGSP